MPVVVVIPVKSFVLGKQRLADALTPQARTRLGQGLADHVASTATSAGLLPLIVTADSAVAGWATLAGFPSIADPGDGLDVAATTGMEWVMEAQSEWVVVHSDLPLVSPQDLTALADALALGQDVIAPSADGGTSAIGSRTAVTFSFGVSSFHQHLPRLDNPTVVARPGLLLDIDSVHDLESVSATAKGGWIRDLIRGSGVPAEGHNLY